MGKRLSYLVLFMLMLLSSGAANASNEVFHHSYYFTCVPNGSGTFHFSFPVFSRANWNHWLGKSGDNTSYISVKCPNAKEKDFILAKIYAENYSGVKEGTTETAHIGAIHGGTIIANNKTYTNNDYSDITTDKAKSVEDQPTLYLSFDYVPEQGYFTDNSQITFTFHVRDASRHPGSDDERDFNLGTYTYNSLVRQPSLIEPYLDVNASPSEQGQMLFTWASTREVHEIQAVVIDGNDQKTINVALSKAATYGEFVIPQMNKGKQVYIKAKMFADKDGQVPVWVNSEVVQMKAYHNLEGGKLTCKNTDTLSTSFNTGKTALKWNLVDPIDDDYISTDAFTVKRAYSADFSDAETIGSVFMTEPYQEDKKFIGMDSIMLTNGEIRFDSTYKVTNAHYSFVDSTWGCAFDPNNLDSKDSVFVFAQLDPVKFSADKTKEFYDEICKKNNNQNEIEARRDLLSMLMVPKRVVYYGVERTSTGTIWDEVTPKFKMVGSVYKTLQLPLISKAELVPSDKWNINREVNIKIELKNYRIYELPEYMKAYPEHSNPPISREIRALYPMRLYTWDPKASIKVVRHCRETGSSTVINVSGENVKMDADSSFYVNVKDAIEDAFSHYYYTAYVDASNSYLPINRKGLEPFKVSMTKDSLYYEDCATIDTLFADTDDPNFIRVQWSRNVGPFSAYRLERHIGKGSEYEAIELIDSTANFYVDKTIGTGDKGYYRLTIVNYHNGVLHKSESKEISAYRSNTGIVKGKVTTPSGVGVPNLKIEAFDGFTGDKVRTDTTDADGSYKFELSTLWCQKFLIKVSGSQTSGYKTSDGQESHLIKFSSEKMTYDNKNFICNNVKQFVGRVLYENTTVPVKDAHFKVNGSYLYNADGGLLGSDSYGNFSFEVPESQVTVQVVKNGHHFRNHGYIFENNQRPIDTVFTPTADYKGLIIYDSTTVRLAGRIAAGKTQAKLPLGFGLSKNYIGDSLTIVMQLEGDQTALLYYNNKENITSFDTVVEHPGNSKLSTKVITERKRVIIKPDTATGEFFVDLLPVKYKITQMYAEGYPNMFAAGEAAQIIDLSADSIISAKEYDYPVDQKDTIHIAYNQAYIREFHVPVELTYKQLDYGLVSNKLGEQKMKVPNLYEREITYNLVEEDKDTKEVSYLLGHPVFEEGKFYTMYAYAKEVFYYNNKQKGDGKEKRVYYDVVPNGTLIISNGLTTDKKPKSIQMDENGMASFTFTANNPTFSLTEEDALRYLNVSVAVDGYYYDANPQLAAFVTGTREKATDIYNYTVKDNSIKLLQILRDPPGDNSYSYLETGKKYTLEREKNVKVEIGTNLAFKYGTNYTAVIGTVSSAPGAFYGNVMKGSNSFDYDIDIPIINYNYNRKAEYTFEIGERIETSKEVGQVGAMADVYLGFTESQQVGKVDALSLIDYETYKAVQPAIASGAIKVLAKSQGAVGDSAAAYLVVAEKISLKASTPSTFIYTQEHILTNVIPNLVRQRDALIKNCTKKVADSIANATHKPVYYSDLSADDANFGIDGFYKVAKPKVGQDNDEVSDLNKSILDWMSIIECNEKLKVATIYAQTDSSSNFSISGGLKYEYVESSASYDTKDPSSTNYSRWGFVQGASEKGVDFINSLANWGTDALGDKIKDTKFGNWYKNLTQSEDQGELNKLTKKLNGLKIWSDTSAKKRDDKYKPSALDVETPTSKFKIEFTPKIDFTWDDDSDSKQTNKGKSGFVLQTNSDSYLEIAVKRVPNDTSADAASFYEWVTDGSDYYSPDESNYLHDYMFYVKGGATRSPYEEPDSTLIFKPGIPLGVATLKIDNPKIVISNPVVSNVPQDEKAIFSVKLINESESQNAIQAGLSSSFTLKLKDATNPNGAKIYMDGMPITDGRKFSIPCGGYITKTIEVERGTGYDITNLGLTLKTEKGSLSDVAYISVNYLPTSCPVQIISPVDKWVLNTLSQYDSLGYYIPVEVSGFNVNYDGFDHIEIQYKESNRGEDSWTNLCSYFADQELYEKATGNKKLLTAGSIKLPFHGEKDPMEMKYDIRAVSFCRLGNGYVTRFSDVVSGIKDTRCPSVFGLPEPTNGLLEYGGVIKLPFTEPIAYNYLDKTSNFEIVGYKNSTSLSESTALKFPGNANQKAQSEVARNLVEHNFTIDMMVMANETNKDMTFFSHGDEIQNMTFGVNSNNQLVAKINSDTFVSQELDVKLTSSFKRVGLMVNNKTQKVSFFIGNEILPMVEDEKDTLSSPYRGNGPVYLGTNINSPKENLFAGSMLEVRLWGDTLTSEEMTAYNSKLLTNHESDLIAHYPLTETRDNIAHDEVNGANLVLENTIWATKTGRSLSTGIKPVEMNPDFTSTNVTTDFSLMFWFKSGEKLDKNTDTLAIFTAGAASLPDSGSNKLFIGYEANKLVVRSNGVSHSLGNTYTDAEWHHLTMTVNRAKNAANFYVDGNLVSQLSANEFGGIASDYAALGNKKMNFNIDLFTLWNLALPSSFIAKNYNDIPDETDTNIRLYLPFEQNNESEQSLVQTMFSPYNEKREYDSNVNIYRKKELVLTNVSDLNDDQTTWAPVTQVATLSKLDFKWSSTDQVLLINLLENDKDINHQEIYFTVKNVEDLNGNVMQNPEMWSVYTSLNQVSFKEKEMLVTADYEEDGTMYLTMTNKTGTYRNYKMYNSAEWLVPEETMGSIDPNTEQLVKFTIKGINDPGEYFDIVYLEDENGLVSSCVINLVVNGAKPDYEIDKNEFDYTMTYKGQVMVKTANGNQIIDNNKNDVVYAFINDKCVGKANIKVANDDKAYVYMTIYGTAENDDNSDVVSFRMWNSTTGKITAMSSISAPVHFLKDGQLGCGSKSDTLYEAATKINSLHLNKGWNWISVNVKPTAGRKCIANMFVSSYTPFSSGDIIKSPTHYDEYSAAHKTWTNNIKQIGNDTVYLVKVENEGIYNIIGEELGDETIEIKGNQWSHLPYLLNATTPINTALADLQKGEGAQPGDMVKSLTAFAFLSEDHVWEGDLEYLKAGEGYFIKLQTDKTIPITYHKKSAGTKSRRVANAVAAESNTVATHANNMPVIAKFAEGVEYNENDKLVAYANGEKAGEAALKNINGNDMFLLSVNAEDGDAIVFAQVRDGETIATTKSAVKYDANGVLGSSQSPYEIAFTNDFFKASPTLFTEDVTFSYNSTNDAEGYIKVYATDGSLVWSAELKGNTQSVVNMNGSHLASGVYYAVAKMGDAVETIKIIKE